MWPLTSVSTLSQALDRSHFVSWDKLNGYAQTHQKSPKKRTHINQTPRLQQIRAYLKSPTCSSERKVI